MNNVKKYNKIVESLVQRYFQELKNKKIFLFEIDSMRFSAMSIEMFFIKFIIVSKKSRKYSYSALKGMFAHELSHFSLIEEMGFLENFFYFLKLLFSKKIRADFERKADVLTIEKGLANDLTSLKKEDARGRTKKDLESKYKRGYLSISEINLLRKNYE